MAKKINPIRSRDRGSRSASNGVKKNEVIKKVNKISSRASGRSASCVCMNGICKCRMCGYECVNGKCECVCR